jgi:hypothetical protein
MTRNVLFVFKLRDLPIQMGDVATSLGYLKVIHAFLKKVYVEVSRRARGGGLKV